MSAQKNSKPGESETAAAASAEGQQIRVALNNAGLRTSYANVFQTRCTAEEVILCCGLGLPESVNNAEGAVKNVLAVDLDRRIVMSPASARRLLLALDRTLKEHAARFGGNADGDNA